MFLVLSPLYPLLVYVSFICGDSFAYSVFLKGLFLHSALSGCFLVLCSLFALPQFLQLLLGS